MSAATYRVTLPPGARPRRDGSTTCPATRAGEGVHTWLPNRDRTAFTCSCGARAERKES